MFYTKRYEHTFTHIARIMNAEPIFYRRNLPHVHPVDSVFFITFRLADSLPTHILQELRDESAREQSILETQLREQKLNERNFQLASYGFTRNRLGATMCGSTVVKLARIGLRKMISLKLWPMRCMLSMTNVIG